MTERRYDYTSRRSEDVLNRIRRFVFDACKNGVTQGQVAKHLDMSVTGVGRYLAYMCEHDMIHIVYPQTKGDGNQPGYYRIGPQPPPPKRKFSYFTLDPLAAALYGRNE